MAVILDNWKSKQTQFIRRSPKDYLSNSWFQVSGKLQNYCCHIIKECVYILYTGILISMMCGLTCFWSGFHQFVWCVPSLSFAIQNAPIPILSIIYNFTCGIQMIFTIFYSIYKTAESWGFKGSSCLNYLSKGFSEDIDALHRWKVLSILRTDNITMMKLHWQLDFGSKMTMYCFTVVSDLTMALYTI